MKALLFTAALAALLAGALSKTAPRDPVTVQDLPYSAGLPPDRFAQQDRAGYRPWKGYAQVCEEPLPVLPGRWCWSTMPHEAKAPTLNFGWPQAEESDCVEALAQPPASDTAMAYSAKVLAYQAACLHMPVRSTEADLRAYGIYALPSPNSAGSTTEPPNWSSTLPQPQALNWDSLERAFQHALLMELARTVDSLLMATKKYEQPLTPTPGTEHTTTRPAEQ